MRDAGSTRRARRDHRLCRWDRRIWLAAVLVGALACLDAGAQNLLVNPEFDDADGRAGWLETGVWSTEDRLADPASGSLQITNAFTESVVLLARQCVPVEEGARYDFGGFVHAASGQFAGPTTAAISVAWWSQPACYAGVVVGSSALIGAAAQTGDWEEIGPTSVTAPPGAAGADVRLQVLKGAGAGSFTAFFDGIFVPEPSTAGGALAASATLLAIARRRAARSRR